MTKKNTKMNKGFVILFAITMASLILSMTLAVSNIAFREIRFSTDAKASIDAFYAADIGAEKVFYDDVTNPSNYPVGASSGTYNFPDIVVTGLDSTGQSCARVSIVKVKDTAENSLLITVTSKGYNINVASCNPGSSNIEREVVLSY